jgi:DNA-binding MarR family transcriptional regulator
MLLAVSPTGERVPARLRELPSRLIVQAALVANRLVAEELAAVGLRRHHYAVLATLAELGPASQSSLSDRSAIDRADMVQALDELVERELVERAPDATDRRRNVVSITASGRRELSKLDRVVAAIQERLLAALSSRERGQLARLLGRVVDSHAPGAVTEAAPSLDQNAAKTALRGRLARNGRLRAAARRR